MLQTARQPVPDHVRHLGRRAQLDDVFSPVVSGECAAAFDRRRCDPGVAKGAANSVGRAGERIGSGIGNEPAVEQDVARERRMNQLRATGGGPGIDDRLAGVVADLDQGASVLGEIGVRGDDRRDDLADETDLADRDHRPRRALIFEPVALVHPRLDGQDRIGEVRSDEDTADAGRRFRAGGLDSRDPGAGVGASQERHVQAARRHDVVDISPSPGHHGQPFVVGIDRHRDHRTRSRTARILGSFRPRVQRQSTRGLSSA